jgi:hypothetical protein
MIYRYTDIYIGSVRKFIQSFGFSQIVHSSICKKSVDSLMSRIVN